MIRNIANILNMVILPLFVMLLVVTLNYQDYPKAAVMGEQTESPPFITRSQGVAEDKNTFTQISENVFVKKLEGTAYPVLSLYNDATSESVQYDFFGFDTFSEEAPTAVYFTSPHLVVKTLRQGASSFEAKVWIIDVATGELLPNNFREASGKTSIHFLDVNSRSYVIEVTKLTGLCESCSTGAVLKVFRYNKDFQQIFELASEKDFLLPAEYFEDKRIELSRLIEEYQSAY